MNRVGRLWAIFALCIFVGLMAFLFFYKKRYQSEAATHQFKIGQKIDSLNGVYVFYNGAFSNVSGRNIAPDGYNLGLKYQCVEFVKRYYYQHLKHKMPDSYGHAKDFFKKSLPDGQMNKARNLTQYTNPSKERPKPNDLLVFSGHAFNKFGHVAVVAKVFDNEIEIIQQNPGVFGGSRASIQLRNEGGKWKLKDAGVLGWLRK